MCAVDGSNSLFLNTQGKEGQKQLSVAGMDTVDARFTQPVLITCSELQWTLSIWTPNRWCLHTNTSIKSVTLRNPRLEMMPTLQRVKQSPTQTQGRGMLVDWVGKAGISM